MRRSSWILVAVCVVLAAFLAMVAVPLRNQSRPDITAADATRMLNELGAAFEKESEREVTSFAAEDAVVAGRNLERIRELLRMAFRNMKDPRVEWRDIEFHRDSPERAHVNATVYVSDAGAPDPQTTYGPHRASFVVERRAYQHLLGLITVYRWKITNVEMPQLPDVGLPF